MRKIKVYLMIFALLFGSILPSAPIYANDDETLEQTEKLEQEKLIDDDHKDQQQNKLDQDKPSHEKPSAGKELKEDEKVDQKNDKNDKKDNNDKKEQSSKKSKEDEKTSNEKSKQKESVSETDESTNNELSNVCGEGNIRLSLKGQNNPSLFPRNTYMATIQVNASGDGARFKDSVLTLEMNHDVIDDFNMDLPSLATDMEVRHENGKTYLDFHFDEIRGGEDFSFDVPIKIDSSEGTFPEGFETVISGSLNTHLEDCEDIAVDSDKDLSFTTKYNEHHITKKTNGSASDGAPVYGGEWNGESFDPASIVTYTYDLDYSQSGNVYRNQFRAYEEVEIIDVLPKDAVFDPDLNPGWELIDNGTKVRYVLTEESQSRQGNRWFEDDIDNLSLNLTFPDVELGEYVTNEVEAHFKQSKREENEQKYNHKEPDHKTEDSISNIFDGALQGIADKKAGSTYGKGTPEYDELRTIKDVSSDKAADHTWYYNFKNPYPTAVKSFTATDLIDGEKSLDERMKFTTIDLASEKDNVEKIIVYDENGQAIDELQPNSSGKYDLGDNAHGFKVVLKEIQPTETIRFTADSVFINPEEVSFDKETLDNNKLANTVQYGGIINEGTDAEKTFDLESEAEFLLTASDEKIKVTKAADNGSKVYRSGEIVSYHLRVFYKDLDLNRTLDNLKIVDLIPLGLDPVEPDFRGEGTLNTVKRLQDRGVYDYDIVENYENSGKTAYVFDLSGYTIAELIDRYPQVGGTERDPFFIVPVQFIVNRNSNIAENRVNEMLTFYDGDQIEIATNASKKDNPFYDPDDPNSVEVIPGSDRSYLYAEESIVHSQKYINDDNNESWGTVRELGPNETYNYRLQVYNNTDNSINDLIVYDKLPAIDDKYITPNQSGQYGDRGSQFVNDLTGPVTADHDGFTIYYSVEDPDENSSDFVKDDDVWLTEEAIEDFSQVTAIKAVLNDGEQVNAKSEVNFFVPMKAPAFEDETYESFNTFAYSRDGGNNFDEANSAKNSITIEKTDVSVEKVWEHVPNYKDEPPVTIQLTQKLDDEVTETYQVELDGTEDKPWSYVWKDLPKTDNEGNEYEYILEEIETPEDYESETTGDLKTGVTITNTYVGTIDLPVEKVWKGSEEDEITVELLADGEKIQSKTLTAKDNWQTTFADLPEVDPDTGKVIEYTIKEVEIDGYQSIITCDDEGKITITNVRSGKTDISGEKEWDLGKDGEQYMPDEITVNLYKDTDHEKIFVDDQTVAPDSDGNWSYEFTDLPKYDAEGEEIEYFIEEIEVKGFTTEINDFNIVNTQETIEISGEKTWADSEGNARPEDKITIQLLNKDKMEVVAEQDISTKESETYTFTDLPKYDKDGQEIKYTINEKNVPGYQAEIAGNNIHNVRTEPQDISVTKMWLDENDDARPESINVQLYKNGEPYGDTVEITPENDWTYTYEELDQFDDEGQPVEYTVEEVSKDYNYETSEILWDADEHRHIIKNVRVGETEVKVEKVWQGEPAEKVTINLLANNQVVKSIELTESNEWEYIFEKLDEFDDQGQSIDYMIEEVEVDGYETEITGDADEGFTVTNTRTGEVDISVEKVWKGEAGEEVTINLLANGEEESTVELTAEDDWTHTFKDLAEFDDEGEPIEYTVEEVEVDGYETEITGNADEGFTVTNTRTGEIEIPVEKVWQLYKAEKQPVQVDLLQNEAVIDTIELSDDNDWKHTFEQLDAYDETGTMYEYEVIEQAIDGFETKVTGDQLDGYTITNREKTTEPNITKDVEGKKHLDVAFDQTYQYNIITDLPNNIESYEKFIITDEVDPGLVVEDVIVTVDGEAHQGVELTVDGNYVKVTVVDFESLAGRDYIEIVIHSQVHPETDVSKYEDQLIPNTANLTFTNESGEEGHIETEPVTVTPPDQPKVETPKDPKDSDEEKVTEKPDEDQLVQSKVSHLLPSTATGIFNLIFVGIVLLGFGIFILVRRKQQTE